jgi:hypothetical protein
MHRTITFSSLPPTSLTCGYGEQRPIGLIIVPSLQNVLAPFNLFFQLQPYSRSSLGATEINIIVNFYHFIKRFEEENDQADGCQHQYGGMGELPIDARTISNSDTEAPSIKVLCYTSGINSFAFLQSSGFKS